MMFVNMRVELKVDLNVANIRGKAADSAPNSGVQRSDEFANAMVVDVSYLVVVSSVATCASDAESLDDFDADGDVGETRDENLRMPPSGNAIRGINLKTHAPPSRWP